MRKVTIIYFARENSWVAWILVVSGEVSGGNFWAIYDSSMRW